MAFKMAIQSGGDLAARLRALPDALTKRIVVDALKAGAVPIRDAAEANAPRGTIAPHLAEHIVVSLANRIGEVSGGRWEPRDATEYSVAIGPAKEFFYGLFLEYGWIYHPQARPFMRPAFDAQVDEALAIIADELWAGLSKHAPSTPSTGGGTL